MACSISESDWDGNMRWFGEGKRREVGIDFATPFGKCSRFGGWVENRKVGREDICGEAVEIPAVRAGFPRKLNLAAGILLFD